MKLALLGAVVVAVGLVNRIPGLVAAGGLWIVMGPVVRALAPQRRPTRRAPTDVAADTTDDDATMNGRTFARGSLLLLAVGLPSLALGVLEVGFADAEPAWRFVPIAVGGCLTAIALLSSALMLTGSGIGAIARAGGTPTVPATLTIRSVRSTGTFINEMPRLEFTFAVAPEGLPPYEMTKRATVPYAALGSIKPGDTLKALVDPAKRKAMQIDWDSATSRSGQGDASERLAELHALRDAGQISAEEFDLHRRRILDSV